MQLHVHSQIAHTAKTGTDGKWRAPDSLGYNEHIGAVAAIVSQHLEPDSPGLTQLDLGRVLPRTGQDPAAAAVLLEDLADRAQRSEFEPVTWLEAPEPVEVPGSFAARRRAQHLPAARRRPLRHRHAAGRRANGTRVRHARPAHAIRAARRPGRRGAACPDRRPARLGDQRPGRLRQDPGPGRSRPRLDRGGPGPGDRHHPVPVRPQHPGRRGPGVVQHRPVPGHLPGRRGARGAKIILAGDTSQLQAVENGGGMALLASQLGHVPTGTCSASTRSPQTA
jgi:hypothetical protein